MLKPSALIVPSSRALALLGALVVSGCYHPDIADYGFSCGDNESCPDGFSCVRGLCHKNGVDAAPPACTPQAGVPGCIPDRSLPCDPVCQTGCCADQKCTALNTSTNPPIAALGCVATNNPTGTLYNPCQIAGAQTPQRTDNCVPGLVGITGANSYCLMLCRTDSDCRSGIHCEQRLLEKNGTVASVCGLPPSNCDPTMLTGCPAGRTCYLETPAATGDTTICEISSNEGTNSACQYSRDCLPRYTCPDVGPGAGTCLPVCANATGRCPTATTCQDFGQQYDYCY